MVCAFDYDNYLGKCVIMVDNDGVVSAQSLTTHHPIHPIQYTPRIPQTHDNYYANMHIILYNICMILYYNIYAHVQQINLILFLFA